MPAGDVIRQVSPTSRRFALVIGNSEYEDATLSRLKTPDADAHTLAAALRDPAIGGFDDVQEMINQDEGSVRRAISTFFFDKKPDDMLLLYFSGHGVLDPQGRLFLAVRNSLRNLLKATAIPASFVSENMDDCRSKRQVLILDCCHSGAFAKGTKGDTLAVTKTTFEGNGYGRVVLTASDSTQYALEGDQVIEQASLSLFTHYLLDGLTTGEADLAGDGLVTLDEWYDYAYDRVRGDTSQQTPRKWVYNQQGDLIIAKNPRPVEIKPAELPEKLRVRLKSEYKPDLLEAIRELDELLKGDDPGLVLSSREALERLAAADDSLTVRSKASEVLAGYPLWLEQKRAEAERIALERAEAERLAWEQAEADRFQRERAEQERREKDKVDTARVKRETLDRERAEQERLATERIEAERLARLREEQDRLALQKAEQDRLAQERQVKAKVAIEQAERERLAREEAEAQSQAHERAELDRFLQQTPLPVQPDGKPSYWKAIGLNLLLGFGLFEADPKARRRWLYPAAAFYALLVLFLAFLSISPFSSNFGLYTFLIALAVYGIGFFDVILTCRKRRQQVPAGFPPKAGKTAYPAGQGLGPSAAVGGRSWYRIGILTLTFILAASNIFGTVISLGIGLGYIILVAALYLPSLKPYSRTIRLTYIGYLILSSILQIAIGSGIIAIRTEVIGFGVWLTSLFSWLLIKLSLIALLWLEGKAEDRGS